MLIEETMNLCRCNYLFYLKKIVLKKLNGSSLEAWICKG